MRGRPLSPPSILVLHAMTSFINCPFCSGHEKISEEALTELAMMISVRRFGSDAATAELLNIRNMILNARERGAPVEEYTPPICPTPAKAKYANPEHALPNAIKWKQHPYLCACGYWHLSKQSPTEHASKINSPPASADEFDEIDPLLL